MRGARGPLPTSAKPPDELTAAFPHRSQARIRPLEASEAVDARQASEQYAQATYRAILQALQPHQLRPSSRTAQTRARPAGRRVIGSTNSLLEFRSAAP